jgi:hypothetical protein
MENYQRQMEKIRYCNVWHAMSILLKINNH